MRYRLASKSVPSCPVAGWAHSQNCSRRSFSGILSLLSPSRQWSDAASLGSLLLQPNTEGLSLQLITCYQRDLYANDSKRERVFSLLIISDVRSRKFMIRSNKSQGHIGKELQRLGTVSMVDASRCSYFEAMMIHDLCTGCPFIDNLTVACRENAILLLRVP